MAAAKKKKSNKAADDRIIASAPAADNDIKNTAKLEIAVSAEEENSSVEKNETVSETKVPSAPTEEMPSDKETEASEKTVEPPKDAPGESENTAAPSDVLDDPSITEKKKTDSPKPEAEKRVIKSSVQYSKSAEREKNIRKQVKKRKRRPVLLILFLCSMLVLVAIVYNSITLEPEEEEKAQEVIDVPVTEIITPTPGPDEEQSEPAEEAGQEAEAGQETAEPESETVPEAETESEPVAEHSYQLIVEDVSWEEARERCLNMGGYLAVITSAEELEEITAMAENSGITHIWLGCHRVDGELVWEHEGDYYYRWDSGEPSAYDYNDDVAEDYLMFWEHNGSWYYNDSRNDPCGDYAAFYSGDMGYICEFGLN